MNAMAPPQKLPFNKTFCELQSHSPPWNAQKVWVLTPSKYSENLGSLNYKPLQKIHQVHLDWNEICFDGEQSIVWFSCK